MKSATIATRDIFPLQRQQPQQSGTSLLKNMLSSLKKLLPGRRATPDQKFEFIVEERHIYINRTKYSFHAPNKKFARIAFWCYSALFDVCGEVFTYPVEQHSYENEHQYWIDGKSNGFLDEQETALMTRLISNAKLSEKDRADIANLVTKICQKNKIRDYEVWY